MSDIRINYKEILRNVQILFQNGDIDNETKNELARLVKLSLKNDNCFELNKAFRCLEYGATMKEALNDCIRITSN